MATTTTTIQQTPVGSRKPSFKPIIEQIGAGVAKPKDTFDPKAHLNFKQPSKIHSMEEIGYSATTGVSPVAVSEPFQLFSQTAVERMRSEIVQPEVMEKCQFQSNIAASQLRGYAQKYAPFTYDAWNHPDTLAVVSKIAGVDLVPVFPYEIGHINFSVKSEEETASEIEAITRERKAFADDEGIAGCPWEDDKPVVGWHTDSYPFVCVLMLSDCTNMVGGETALVTGNNDIMKVRGPQMGCAVVLQGRYITHQALRALGAAERITSVTSFRPKSPFMRDETVLTSVRTVSDVSELYYDFGEYRLEILEARIQKQLKDIRDRRRANKKIDTKAFKAFLADQEAFLKHTNNEMVPEESLVMGHIQEVNMPTEGAPRAAKRARVE
ncbi:hypothetical protein K402DRAFT_336180 [Aulographum hederae CBS 113979]|uniref:Fe2OG dioxygenase domain-containing protein n=1 Tax=Aulographum hederae CBS 113979 TaxID=1176131 RepID=A0A6G1GUX0_9PEZI|nr:hypothetical protein K402DRAFT_336180 [Aulographum hederae CBS 113979]